MDPKQLALEHFEKAILAVAGLVLLITAGGMVSPPKELGKNAKLNKQMEDIDKYMRQAQVDEEGSPTWVQDLRRQLSADEVGRVDTFPGWTLHRRPTLLYYNKRVAEKHKASHFAPVNVSADPAERGRIVVSWDPSVENEYVIVTEYQVERRVGDDGDWSQIGTAPGTDTRYEDGDVVSRMAYSYRVVSIAEVDRDNPVVRHENMLLADGQRQKTSEASDTAETARDMFIVPVTVQAVTDADLIARPNAKESAYVKVYKWDPGSNEFISKAFNVNIGDPIGKKVKIRRREIDFSTGAKLVDVEIRKRRNEKLGYDESVQVVRYRFKDGQEEEANDKDKPAELSGK